MKAKAQTWLEQLRTGAIKSNIVRVLKYIQDAGIGGTSIYEMRDALGMSHQSLTATISILADTGLLFEAGMFQRGSSWYTIYVFVANEDARREIADKRRREKFQQWLNRGVDEYTDLMSPQFKFDLIIEQSGGNNELGI